MGLKHTFLRSGIKNTIFFYRLIYLDNVDTGKKLQNQPWCNDRGDAQLHKGPAIRGHDDAHPVEWIRRFAAHDSIKWDLRAHKKNEERDGSPKHLFTELDLGHTCAKTYLSLRFSNTGKDGQKRAH